MAHLLVTGRHHIRILGWDWSPEGGATTFPRRDIRASAPRHPTLTPFRTCTQLLLSPHVLYSTAPQLQRGPRQCYRTVLKVAGIIERLFQPVSGLYLHSSSLLPGRQVQNSNF